jgi:hypothetical protein
VELTLFTNLLGAIGLGAASGLNAWIPLLGLGLAERAGLVTLSEPFDRLGSTGVLVALGVVFLIDLIGDKVPVVDSVLHAVGTIVAPVSGAIVFAAQENLLSQSHPWAAAVAGMVLGETVHLARSAIRPAVTAGTGGVGNPIASAIEDAISFVLTVLAVLVPLLAFVGVVTGAVLVVRRRRRRRGGAAAAAFADVRVEGPDGAFCSLFAIRRAPPPSPTLPPSRGKGEERATPPATAQSSPAHPAPQSPPSTGRAASAGSSRTPPWSRTPAPA